MTEDKPYQAPGQKRLEFQRRRGRIFQEPMKTEKFEGKFIVEEHAFRDERKGLSPSEFLRDTAEQGRIDVEHAVTPARAVSGIACMGFPGESEADASPGGHEVAFSVAHGEGAFFDILIYSSTARIRSSREYMDILRSHFESKISPAPSRRHEAMPPAANEYEPGAPPTFFVKPACPLVRYIFVATPLIIAGRDPCAFFQRAGTFPFRVDTEPPVPYRKAAK